MSSEEPPDTVKPLSEEEKARLARWYEQHGVKVVAEVRQWLRRQTMARTGASVSAVAHSVWLSFSMKHLEDVDPGDDNSAWAILSKAAKRHCEAWNRYGTRHPQVSIQRLPGLEVADTREATPEVDVMIVELSELMRQLGDGRSSVPAGSGHLGLIGVLQPQEREVLGLKLARETRTEIAAQMQIFEAEVDDLWKAVKRKAEAIGSASGA